MSYTPTDYDAMFRTIYGEARGESLEGMIAVGWVIRNRATIGGWWGNTIKDVCYKPYQFSCWNENDPNFNILQSLALSNKGALMCLGVAAAVLNEIEPDPTKGATHYHTKQVKPKWASQIDKITATIGNHIFYKGIK